jgi:hypothetical protein
MDYMPTRDFNLGTLPSLNSTSSGGGGGSGMMSAGMNILGTVLGIGTSIYAASLQNKVSKANAQLVQAQGNYASSVQAYNASVEQARGLAIRTIADFEIDRIGVAAERFRSGQQAGYAKAGVKTSGGSPLSVMVDTATQFKLDQAITDYNAKVGIAQSSNKAEQYGILGNLEKSNAQFKSSQLLTEGKYRVGQSYANAFNQGTSLLSTVSGYSR